MQLLAPILIALMASLGNSLFAAGQKKAVLLDNNFMFITLTTTSCVTFMVLALPLFGPANYVLSIKQNWFWAISSGFGLFITYIGFSLLFSKYGVSYYILFAVMAIISTGFVTGVVIFKETFNLFHWLAFACSILTVLLFTLGNWTAHK